MRATTADRRRSATAWAVSLATHALLTASLVWAAARGGVEPSGTEPTREVGIVIRESPNPPAPFEDSSSDSDREVPDPAPLELVDDSNSAPAPPSPFSGLLDELLDDKGQGPAPRSGGGAAPAPAGGGRLSIPIGKARVPFFGAEGVGSRFVFALDRSTSMRGARLRAAKAELIASFEALGPTHQFQVLFFSTRVTAFDLSGRKRLAFGDETSKLRAVDFVKSVQADGVTDRLAALRAALRYGPDVVFFLTDDDTPMAQADLAEVIDEAAGAVTIHAIEFGVGPDTGRSNFLTQLARATGGERRYVDTSHFAR